MPGSVTVRRRRRATFGCVMPVARSLASLRCGSRPNSGQSSSRAAEPLAGDGIAPGGRCRRGDVGRARCCRRPPQARRSPRRVRARVRWTARMMGVVLAHRPVAGPWREPPCCGRYAPSRGPQGGRDRQDEEVQRRWPRPRRSASRRRISSLPGTDGPFRLSEHRGERVVLLFYPGDNTMVCTKQFCSYRDRADDFAELGATVVGISSQDLESHEGFVAKHQLNVPLLADVDKQVARSYDAFSPPPGRQARGDRDRRAGHRAPPPRPPARARLPVGGRPQGGARRAARTGRGLGVRLAAGRSASIAQAPSAAAASRSRRGHARRRRARRSSVGELQLQAARLSPGAGERGARARRRRDPTSSGCRRRRVRACRAAPRAAPRTRSARPARRGGRGCAASGRPRRCRPCARRRVRRRRRASARAGARRSRRPGCSPRARARPGRRQQMPRTLSSTCTPACEAA